jgi:alpha-1,6-mannosyltransferase
MIPTMIPRTALLLPGVGLLILTAAALALYIPDVAVVGIHVRRYAFVALLGLASAVYLVAVYVALRGPTIRYSLQIVLAVAVGMRLIVLFADPLLSTDVYRYMWDGRVQVAGIDPYRYVPADPALRSLREDLIYPKISRPDADTPYPPAAQLVFQAVARISQSVLAMKLAMVAFEALGCWAMLRVLALARLPGTRVLIYAWNPGAVWSFAGDGHVDAIAIGVLAVALLLRALRRDTWVGAALGIAVLVKFLPAAMAPALWRARGHHWAAWRTPLAAIVVMAALYIPYINVWRDMLGSLIFYFHDEDLAQGSGIWLLSGIGTFMELPQSASVVYGACALAVLAALAAWVAFRPRPPIGDALDIRRVCADAALLGAALTIVISPHYQWYFVWLALPCCVSPRWGILWLSVASAVLYLPHIGIWFYWPCLIYLPAAALGMWEWRQSLAPRPFIDAKVTQGSL